MVQAVTLLKMHVAVKHEPVAQGVKRKRVNQSDLGSFHDGEDPHDDSYCPLRSFRREELVLFRNLIDAETETRSQNPELAPYKPVDIERFAFMMEWLVKPFERERERFRHPRDMWTHEEDSFIEQAMEAGAKPREALEVYQKRFPDLSANKTAEVLRSRYRVLMNAKKKQAKRAAEEAQKIALGGQSSGKKPKHKGPLRIFGECHLELLLKLIKDEVLYRLEMVSYRQASTLEKKVCKTVLNFLPEIFAIPPEASSTPEVSSAEESLELREAVVERPRRRLPHNAYTPEQNAWLLSKIATPTQRYSWTRIRSEFQATFPDTIRTGAQLRDRSATLRKQAANQQLSLVAADSADKHAPAPFLYTEKKHRNIMKGSAFAAINNEGEQEE